MSAKATAKPIPATGNNDEFQRLEKKHKGLQERKAEADQKLSLAESELNALRDQSARARRLLDDMTIEKQVAEKNKNDIEAGHKHLAELKKQNNKHINELQLQVNTLEAKLLEYQNKEARHQQQKTRDLHVIENSRKHLQTHEVYNFRKLESEERNLQAKFMTVKQDLKRKFIHDLDLVKESNQHQVNDLTQKHKSKMEHLQKHLGDKINDMKAESRAYSREYDLISLEMKELTENQHRLEQTLKKEKLISVLKGTDSIEWLSKAGLENEGHRNVIVDLERTLNDLRQRLLETGDQLEVANKQKVATLAATKKLKYDLEDQIRAYQLLEVSKKDMERRLTKKVVELDAQIERKKQVAANEHTTKRAKLQAEIDGKAEETRDLQKQILDIEGELSSIHLSTASLSQRLTEKLVQERNHLFELETEKREWEVKSRRVQASVDCLTEQLASLEKETSRLKAQAFNAQNDLVEEQDKNSLLEQTIKRLEARI